MNRYAKKTSVPVERSRAEIEETLMRFGATDFAFVNSLTHGQSRIEFIAHGRQIRFVLTLPGRDETSQNKYDQMCRARWRALLLSIKAKLVATEEGIASFESEFLANIVNPANNRTVYEEAVPQLTASYEKKPAAILLTKE